MEDRMKIRAVQLDLARQMENLSFIKEFIDFSSDFGYNCLVLYLEARIKTASFPYPSASQCYTGDQIKQIVSYAADKKMDVIPVVPNLGHTEQVLQFSPLSHLAELREGVSGRFSRSLSMVCPSLEETYEFFEKYYTEVASLFPSPYFHVGNDESWDIGYCSLCRKRLEKGESQADIFTRHLRKTHQIVAGKLGKKMIIWDDLLEHYQKSLLEIPRDIVLCCWHYDELVDIPRAHFCNLQRQDSLKLYDRLGFSYFIAPAETSPANAESFTRYAARYHPLGGHLTTWEKGTSFLYEHYPTIAYIGCLWEKGILEQSSTLFHEVCQEIFRVKDRSFLEAIRLNQYLGKWPALSNVESLRRGPFTPYENKRLLVADYLYQQLVPFTSRVKTNLGRKVLEDILVSLQEEILALGLRKVVAGLDDASPLAGQRRYFLSTGRSLLKQVSCLKKQRLSQWRRHRTNLPGTRMAERFENCQKSLSSFLRKYSADKPSLLQVNYFLPDAYNAQKICLQVKFSGSKNWKEVYTGVPKPNLSDPSQTPFFTFSYFLPENRIPRQLLVSSWGYGGLGITFVKVITRKGIFVPKEIVSTEGLVFRPEAILVEDSRWCYLGEQDVASQFSHPEKASRVHRMQIRFL